MARVKKRVAGIIIGLLVGGVLQGKELVNQAQIRNLITQVADYDRAVNTFRAKYGANSLPGDFNRASTFGLDQDNEGNS